MLLTLAPPMQNDIKPPHDHPSYKSHPSRYSPPDSPRTLRSFFDATESRMNNSHRGLPPPVGMSLPPPSDRPSSSLQPLGHLPAPPSQWAGADESMRQWLHAKAEEDRRKQEEERTKQETLKLDQRKIEQTMLRESLQGGVPPPMVPLIFAGMGSGNLSTHTLEWAQQYLTSLSLQNQQQQQQIQAQQQQLQQAQHQPSPELQRDHRTIPPNPYGPPQPLPAPSVHAVATPPVPSGRSVVVPPPSTSLSRLNTVDLQPLPAPPPRQPLQPAQSAPTEQTSGPGLFFHHWTPPSNHPPTPSGKSNQGSPFAPNAASHLRSDYQGTPKKRKMTGSSASQHAERSPPHISNRSSRERESSPHPRHRDDAHDPHRRQRSDESLRDDDGKR